MNYSQETTHLICFHYNGYIIYNEGNGLYRQGNFTGTLQEVKNEIDKPFEMVEVQKGIFVHPSKVKEYEK